MIYKIFVCLGRYKQQLSASLKRERALKQMQIQVELEWQRRCEDMKVEHCLANEQLIQELTQARDQVSLSYIQHNPSLYSVCGFTGAHV